MTIIKNHLKLIILFTVISRFGYTQVPMSDYLTFTGHVDFTIFGTTNNIRHNEEIDFNCQTDNVSSSTAEFVLPPLATIRKALLYWAGSGEGDFNVKFSGPGFTDLAINAERTFLTTVDNALNQTFFSGMKDVTELLQLHGTGDYTLSDLDANRNQPYCADGHVFSGWFVIVVYEHPDLAYASLTKIYDGFEGIKGESINFNLNNLNILDTDGAKLGFVSWEGEEIAAIEEWLKVNGYFLSNSLNPIDNLFNGSNSFTNSLTNYNMDIDYFDISNFIHVGDSTIEIETYTKTDLTIFNVFAVTFVNKAPNATVTINDIENNCTDRDLSINFSLNNTGNDSIPEGTRIGFYVNDFPGMLLGTYEISATLPPLSNLNINLTITIPDEIPDEFRIIAVADDQQLVGELSETDNTDISYFAFHDNYHTEEIFPFCDGDTLLLYGNTYTDNALDTFHLTTIYGCDSIIYATIRKNPTSADTIHASICKGDYFTFPDNSTTDSVGFFSFFYTNSFGCDSIVNYILNYISDIHTFDLGEDRTVKLGKSTTITPSLNFKPDSIIWSPDLYLENGIDQTKIITPLQSVNYLVTTIDSSGCTQLDSLSITVFAAKNVFFPNAFSPNNDGFNDIFKCFSDDDIKNIKQFIIFDRWGNIVFQQYNITDMNNSFGWNGQYRGKHVQPAVFTYFAEIEFLNGDIELFHGDVTLVR